MTATANEDADSGIGRGTLDRLLEIVDLGISEDSVPRDEMRRIRILTVTTLAMLGVGALYVIRFWSIGIYEMCIALGLTMAVAVANLLLLRAARWPTLSAHVAIAALTTMLVFTNYFTGGFNNPNLSWLYVIPICAAVVLDIRGAALWTLATLAITSAFWLLPEAGIELQDHIPEAIRPAQDFYSRMSAIIAIGLIGASFVASQRRSERELARANQDLSREATYVRLLQDATVSANQAASLEEAMNNSVVRICATMGWCVGQVLNVMEDGRIASSGFTHTEDRERFGRLAKIPRRSSSHAPGKGLRGLAVATGQPKCIYDLAAAGRPSPRSQAALAAGLKSAFVLPVMVDGRARALLEFGHTERYSPDDRLVEVFIHVAEQLGRVAERTALQDRLRQSQKMEAVGQLAAGLAHEINNPMSYVRSNLHLIHDSWQGLLSKAGVDPDDAAVNDELCELQELIEDSIDGVERTISIVRDVKDFARFGGGGSATWTTADLAELMDGAARVASHQFSSALTIERDYEPIPEVTGSPNQLRQVFVNFIVNAMQAIDGEGTIRLVIRREGGLAIARVEDDGPGMTKETQERLFDPFFTTKAPGEGTGLGLYVSYEIARGHGGEILVSSELGHGTTFELRLPIENWPDDDEIGMV